MYGKQFYKKKTGVAWICKRNGPAFFSFGLRENVCGSVLDFYSDVLRKRLKVLKGGS
jgi:hypothetical protein